MGSVYLRFSVILVVVVFHLQSSTLVGGKDTEKEKSSDNISCAILKAVHIYNIRCIVMIFLSKGTCQTKDGKGACILPFKSPLELFGPLVERDGCVWHQMFAVSDEPWCPVAVDGDGVQTDWGLCDMTTGCEIDTGGKLLNITS